PNFEASLATTSQVVVVCWPAGLVGLRSKRLCYRGLSFARFRTDLRYTCPWSSHLCRYQQGFKNISHRVSRGSHQSHSRVEFDSQLRALGAGGLWERSQSFGVFTGRRGFGGYVCKWRDRALVTCGGKNPSLADSSRFQL